MQQQDTPVESTESTPTSEISSPQAPAPAPLPPADTPEDTEAQKTDYWRSVLTGDPATVPLSVRRQSGVDEWDMPDEQREYKLLSTINRSWAADHMPYTQEEISVSWGQRRRELTQKLGVQNNEHELFLALSQETSDAPRREASTRIVNTCYMAGLDGKQQVDVEALLHGLSPQDAENARTLAQAAYRQGHDNREKLHELADTIARGVDAFAAVEEEAIPAMRVFNAAPHLLQAVDELADLDEQQRNTVLYLAAGMVRQDREGEEADGLVSRTVQAIRRGTSRMSMGMVQAISHTGIATLNNVGRRMESDSMVQAASAWDKRMQMLDKLRRLSQDELRPLVLPDEEGGAASYLITAAESTPAAILSCCGGAGFTALTMGAVGESVAEARNRAPMASQELQLYAGLLGGTIQAGIYMNLNRVGGRLLEQSISRLGRASGQGIAGYTLAGLNVLGSSSAEAAKMLAAGKLANAADLGAQEMAARLSNTASNIDWQTFGSNLTDIEVNMHEAAGLLPFLLLGSGRLALQHFRSPRAILGDGRMLEEWGVSPDQRRAIMAEPRPDVKSEMLREALSSNKTWGGLGFLPKISRAMYLLHSDNVRPFRDAKTIRDFLKLPEPIDSPTPPSPSEPAISTAPRMEAINLRRQWWKHSQIPEGEIPRLELPPPVPAYVPPSEVPKPTLMPRRMREPGVYAPHAEPERRTMFHERLRSLEALSYRFLLQTYSEPTLMRSEEGKLPWSERTERTRRNVLLAVTRALMGVGRGDSEQTAMKRLGDHLNRYRTLSGQQPSAEPNPRGGDVEELPHNRLMNDLQLETFALAELLPLMSDFQTALTRGCTPEQAYGLIMCQALHLPTEAMQEFHPTGGRELKNLTPMKKYTKRNDARYATYSQLTGHYVEYARGENGHTYARAKRPNGSHTPWHSQIVEVVNDVAGNADLSFMPFGHQMNMHEQVASQKTARRRSGHASFNLLRSPLAVKNEFSVYDQMCSKATWDMGQLWLETATLVQPGLHIENERRYVKEGDDIDITPRVYKLSPHSTEYTMDTLWSTTPLALLLGRCKVYWRRSISAGITSPEMIGDALVDCGFITAEERENILNPPEQRIYYRRRGLDSRLLTRERQMAMVPTNIADKMAEYTALAFIANMQKLSLPGSFKEWVATAPFAPTDFPPTEEADRRALTVNQGAAPLINWANRRAQDWLVSRAPMVEKIRRSKTERPHLINPFFDSLMTEAVGNDTNWNYEKGWCFHIGGAPVLHGASQWHWQILRRPIETWKAMNEADRERLRTYLSEYCQHEPLFSHSENPDKNPVEAGLEMLDELLQTYNQMHRYATIPNKPSHVQLIVMDKPKPNNAAEEPSYSRIPLFVADEIMKPGFVVRSTKNVPDFVRYDSRVYPCLGLLDHLRRYPSNLPYAYKDGIWWNGTKYGIDGACPDHLENYTPERPLQPIIRLLQEIGEGQTLNICGLEIPGLEANLNLSAFDAITIYRSPHDPNSIYRLMPGDASLEHSAVRLPYLVHCRDGVYLNSHSAVSTPEEMENIMVPLHNFMRQPIRSYTLHGREWSEMAYKYNLKQATRYSLRTNFLKSEQNHPTYMLESLMRLAEDSGFSSSLREVDPATFTPGQAKLLIMIRDMIACLCSEDPTPSYRRMAKMARGYRAVPRRLTPLLETLMQTKSADTTPQNIMSAELNKALKELDIEAEQPQESAPTP